MERIKVFIVTPGGHIIKRSILKAETNNTYFTVKLIMRIFPVLVRWFDLDPFTEYCAFEDEKDAKAFSEFLVWKRKHGLPAFPFSIINDSDWESILPIIEEAVSQNEPLSISLPENVWDNLNEGGLNHIKNNLSDAAAERVMLRISEFPEKAHRLVVACK